MLSADETNAMRFGNYEVLTKPDGTPDELGRGGFGRTYRARHALIHTEHALKVILDRLVHDVTVTERFLKEAREQAALRHPGIAQITDFGIQRDGTMFYVMEYCPGGDLKKHARETGPLPEAEAFRLIRQAAEAIGYAHGKGLIHRDIKPSNLMLVTDGGGEHQIKIIDFGLVKRLAQEGMEQDAAQTQTGESLWSPTFASPEQIKEAVLDARSDIFSLGMTLWFLLQGGGPVEGTQGVILADRLGPGSYEPRLPRTLSGPGRALLAAMVEKDPRQRPKSCAELIRRIDAVLDGTAAPEPPVSAAGGETEEPPGAEPVIIMPRPRAPGLHERFVLERIPGKNPFLGEVFRGPDAETGLNVRVTRVDRRHPQSVIDTALERVTALIQARPAGIVPVLEMTEFREGWAVIEEEITDGIILGNALKREGAVEFATAAPLLWQAAEALDAAARAGVHATLIERSLVCASPPLSPGGRLPWATLQLRLCLEMVVSKRHELDLDHDQEARSDVTSGQSRNPLQSLATLIYLIVGSRPVPLSAYFSEFAYDAIPGLSETGNGMLAQALAGQNGGSAMAFFQTLAQSEPSSPGPEAVARTAREAARTYSLTRLESSLPPLVSAVEGCQKAVAACDALMRRAVAKARFRPIAARNQELQKVLTEGRKLFDAATASPVHGLIYDHMLAIRRSAIRAVAEARVIAREVTNLRRDEEEFNEEFEKTSSLLTRLISDSSSLEREAGDLSREGAELASALEDADADVTITHHTRTAAAAAADIQRIQQRELPIAGQVEQLEGMRHAAHAAHDSLSAAAAALRGAVDHLREQEGERTRQRERTSLLRIIAPRLAEVTAVMDSAAAAREAFSHFLAGLPAGRQAVVVVQSRESSRIQSKLESLRSETAHYLSPASQLELERLRLVPARLADLARTAKDLEEAASRLAPEAREAISIQEQKEKADLEEKIRILEKVSALAATASATFWETEAQLKDITALLQEHGSVSGGSLIPEFASLRDEAMELERTLSRLRRTLEPFSGPQVEALDMESTRRIPATLEKLGEDATALLATARALKVRVTASIQRGNLARFEEVWQYLEACSAYTSDCFSKVSDCRAPDARGQKILEAAEKACHKARGETREILKIRKALNSAGTAPDPKAVHALAERAAAAAQSAFDELSKATAATGARNPAPVAAPPRHLGRKEPPPPPPPDSDWAPLGRQVEALFRQSDSTESQIRQEFHAIPQGWNAPQHRDAADALGRLMPIRQAIQGLQRELAGPAPEKGSPLTAQLAARLERLETEFDRAAAAARQAVRSVKPDAPPLKPTPAPASRGPTAPAEPVLPTSEWEQLLKDLTGLVQSAQEGARQASTALHTVAGAGEHESAWLQEAAAAAQANARSLADHLQTCRNYPRMDQAACAQARRQAEDWLNAVRGHVEETTRRIATVKEAINERKELQLKQKNAVQAKAECDQTVADFQERRQEAALLQKKFSACPPEYHQQFSYYTHFLENRFEQLWNLKTWIESHQEAPFVTAEELSQCQQQLAELWELPVVPNPPKFRKKTRRGFLLLGGSAIATGTAAALVIRFRDNIVPKKSDQTAKNRPEPVNSLPKIRKNIYLRSKPYSLNEYEKNNIISNENIKLKWINERDYLACNSNMEPKVPNDYDIKEVSDGWEVKRPILQFEGLPDDENIRKQIIVNGYSLFDLDAASNTEWYFPSTGKKPKVDVPDLLTIIIEPTLIGSKKYTCSLNDNPDFFVPVFTFINDTTKFARKIFQEIKIESASENKWPFNKNLEISSKEKIKSGKYKVTLISNVSWISSIDLGEKLLSPIQNSVSIDSLILRIPDNLILQTPAFINANYIEPENAEKRVAYEQSFPAIGAAKVIEIIKSKIFNSKISLSDKFKTEIMLNFEAANVLCESAHLFRTRAMACGYIAQLNEKINNKSYDNIINGDKFVDPDEICNIIKEVSEGEQRKEGFNLRVRYLKNTIFPEITGSKISKISMRIKNLHSTHNKISMDVESDGAVMRIEVEQIDIKKFNVYLN